LGQWQQRGSFYCLYEISTLQLTCWVSPQLDKPNLVLVQGNTPWGSTSPSCSVSTMLDRSYGITCTSFFLMSMTCFLRLWMPIYLSSFHCDLFQFHKLIILKQPTLPKLIAFGVKSNPKGCLVTLCIVTLLESTLCLISSLAFNMDCVRLCRTFA
jgi:hypothetical protein